MISKITKKKLENNISVQIRYSFNSDHFKNHGIISPLVCSFLRFET